MIINIVIGIVILTVAISAVVSIYEYYKENKQGHKYKLTDYLPVRVRRNELISWLHTLIFIVIVVIQYVRLYDVDNTIVKLQNQVIIMQEQMIEYIKQDTDKNQISNKGIKRND